MLRDQLPRFYSCLVFLGSALIYRPGCSVDDDTSETSVVFGY